MAGYSQNDHLLRIDTILNADAAEKKFEGDPLLLVKLDGVEGISRLFAYDVIMLRDAGGRQGEKVNGEKRPPIETTQLIGTHAEIGARPSDKKDNKEDEIFFKRVGMFETFEDILGLDITHFVKEHERDFHIYRARVVPWVKVLSRDICYRVFEKKTVVEIIDAIAEEANKTFSHLIIDTSALKDSKFPPFPPIEYCVQYGESTLEFISRLMARFGIWYFFGHRASGPNFVLNEAMILKRNLDSSVSTAGLGDVKISDDGPGVRNIAKLVRRFRPPERRMVVGGFNYVDPTHPFYKDGTVSLQDDLLKAEGGAPSQTKFSGATSFAEPVFSDAEADALAKTATSRNQSEVLLLSGVSRNHSFVSGHSFRIEKDKDFDPNDDEKKTFADIVDHRFVIDNLAITANDYHYINLSPDIPIIGEIFEAFAHTIAALEADALDNTDNALYKASLWATVTAQAKIYTALNPLYGNFADTAAGTDVDIAGAANKALGVLSGVLPGALAGLGSADFKKAITDKKNLATFAVGVIAVPADPPLDPPLPLSVRPVARGPHTAVVIGDDRSKGADLNGQDVYCDAIGRVRVRFPWDPGPPPSPSELPPRFPVSQPDKPTKVGGNTCWVRVVDSWAGRHYGTQFLPRVGQEVVVDFLDGDPERPVIVGRLYNADTATTNLPFPDEQDKDKQISKLAELPATAKYNLPLSGIKTYSIPATDGDGKALPIRFHLLRFSDKRDKEQYLIRSQHRLDITAFDKRYETIHSDRHLTVGGKKLTPPPKEIGGTYFAKVNKHYHLHVGDPEFPTDSGNRYTLIEQNDEIKVVKDSNHSIGGNWSTDVGGQVTINAMGPMGTIVLNAALNITLMVGTSSIVITPAAISITSPVINLVAPAILSTTPVVPVGAAALPPGIPIPPAVEKPTDPTPADPGDTLTPQE
jgi:uncharacterized protein involved in type VI secretion and phage assembly